jgi:hypothetical protein
MSVLRTLAYLVVIALGYVVASDAIGTVQTHPLLAALPFGGLLLLVRRNAGGNATLVFLAVVCTVVGLTMISGSDPRSIDAQEWAVLIICCIQLVIVGIGAVIVLWMRKSNARRS